MIESIALAELRADLAESLMDMRVCRIALRQGIVRTTRVDVHDRLRKNAEIVRAILAEVERRILAGEMTGDHQGILISTERRP